MDYEVTPDIFAVLKKSEALISNKGSSMRLGAWVLIGVCSLVFTKIALAEDDLKLIGAGVITSTSPYRGIGTRSMAVPVMAWDYKGFYVKGVEAGYHFFQTDRLRLSVLVAPRFMGYHSSDSDALAGMADRKMSMDAGVKAEVPLPWRGTSLSAKIVNDALSRHDGQVAEMSLSKELAGSIWRLMPSAGARIQSGRMTNYYYGVRPDEARADRSEYGPGATVNYFADAMFIFGAPKGWIVITRGGVEFLADEIHKSPIVKKDVLFNGVVGLARKF